MKHLVLPALATALINIPAPVLAHDIWFGADLSYVNEMKDCGAQYSYEGLSDPYAIFAKAGTNLVRVRIWVNAGWTHYSNLPDVEKTIRAARANGMKVLLDFHYSDDWADGGKQIVPAAWARLDEDGQVKALYHYTLNTLDALKAQGLMPDMVQVGNETNGEILQTEPQKDVPIHWARNAKLFNAGIKAVHEASADSAIKPQIMLHIAQPENVEAWFDAATKAGVTGYDIIGMSYYSKWSEENLTGLAATIRRVHAKFGKAVVVVETGYAFTDAFNDKAPNLLGSDSALKGYPVTPQGQALYMHDLMQDVLDAGGEGVVYWEPAWVSTKCHTRWAQGSDWENAAFFDFKGQALPALDWAKAAYVLPVEVRFSVPDTGQSAQYVAGDFSGGIIVTMQRDGANFTYRTWLRPGSTVVAATATSAEAVGDAEALKMTIPQAGGTLVLAAPH
ncbi:glycosyl hydrolase 53 family protein [Asticcacaulis sp. EMRT-3]|uniref:glycoside hydrolase family 53 protein n=1 Tax=Asticcacaulis sp. EMRT-3 TaxID=3040349 RepID=UPI0024AEE7B2|nr:glycosyl hydrolase 53 family protein [Asticcacaulis sp. EMRT-3]MDI7775860.1 glycosyl hydrolase 53 family protein [Asticcacaulis sp. EMRT-3]